MVQTMSCMSVTLWAAKCTTVLNGNITGAGLGIINSNVLHVEYVALSHKWQF